MRTIRSILLLALLVAAPATLAAQERQLFEVPDGAHPHDVAPAPDGDVWYTAQRQGALGILDPSTGEVRHVPLGAGSRPHGVIQGPDGAAWITDSGLNAIVRFDPVTEAISTWPLPDSARNANLNTAAFDGDGVLWFTGQAGFVGRLDPTSGAMAVFPAPRGPYGITATPDGEIYFASLATSYIGHVDRATGEIERLDPPTPDQGARRVWSDSRGRVWVAEWNAGQLAVYDPADGSWREWAPPGGGASIYAVYVDHRDIVWMSDFAANAIHAFDPETEEFTTYPLSAGAAVRQINGRPGEIWLPHSGTDRLEVIRTE